MDQPLTISQALQQATGHHRAGRLRDAEILYRRILNRDPNHADALFYLGTLAGQSNNLPAAISLIQRAIAIQPDNTAYHANLGEFHRRLNQFDLALVSFQRALQLDPSNALSHSNLSLVLTQTGQFDQAIAACNQAIQLQPNLVAAHTNLAFALHRKGDFPAAIEAFRRAMVMQPTRPENHYQLGLVYSLAMRFPEAIDAFQQAVSLKPDYAEAFSDLAVAFMAAYRFDEAVAACRKALQIKPDFPGAQSNLGSALASSGRLTEGIASFRDGIRLWDDPALHSNLLFNLHFHPDYDSAAILREHKIWNDRYAQPLADQIHPHTNDRSPDRPLRIGYLSPDFREHAQSLFTLPLLENHNHAQFQIHCYSTTAAHDDLTRRIRQSADVWHDAHAQSDNALADQIRDDRIDILVDLTMHMADNRLLVFARKPAPIQIAWLAYPGTTGVATIDCRFTDPHLDPPGTTDAHYSERTVHLPDTFWCYGPVDQNLPVLPAPCLQASHITFGCLNAFCKINAAVLDLWAKVLILLPTSRLILLAPHGSARQRTLDNFRSAGVSPDRIEFLPYQQRDQYLQTYHRIDIALDTFPYNGHTTSLDSIWMGVPVVTLIGQTVVGRAGLSQLTNLNLTELAAHTPDDFVRIAADLANDPPRLAHLRATLRDRMKSSLLMDAPRFARNIESAYRSLWQVWTNR